MYIHVFVCLAAGARTPSSQKSIGPQGINDPDALLYTAANKPTLNQDWNRTYNTQGFGAGGLPPLMFSHQNRNWNNTYAPKLRRDAPSDRGGVSEREGDDEWTPHSKKRKLGRLVTVPGAKVTRREGGKGRERIRMKKGEIHSMHER